MTNSALFKQAARLCAPYVLTSLGACAALIFSQTTTAKNLLKTMTASAHNMTEYFVDRCKNGERPLTPND